MPDNEFPRIPKTLRDALSDHLKPRPWTHAITLAFNSGAVTVAAADRALGRFKVRLNRSALGPHWGKKPDEQVFAFWFLEKPQTNTHWHGVLWLEPSHFEKLSKKRTAEHEISQIWSQISPRGTVNFVLLQDKPGWIDYIAKELQSPLQYESFRMFTGTE
jgi:hypothetical protein